MGVAPYDPDYGDNRLCTCGHTYYRHFDSFEKMAPVGCKYCFGEDCEGFEDSGKVENFVDGKRVIEDFNGEVRAHNQG